MAAWLSRQRKGDLVDLATAAGLRDVEALKKDDLTDKLTDYFAANESRLGSDERFKEFYRRTGSPTKRDPTSSTGTGEASVKKRRKTIKDESEHPQSQSSPSARVASPAGPSRSSQGQASASGSTPSRSSSSSGSHLRAPSSTPQHAAGQGSTITTFPPSPAVITNAIENQTAIVSEKLHDMVDKTNIATFMLDIREILSSVIGVEGAVIAIELFKLQQSLMQWQYAADIPAYPALRTPAQAVYFPDPFVLLTSAFWHPTLLYLLTCLIIPLVASWFFNLTIRPTARHGSTVLKPRWRCDPLTFNVVRGLMIWLVFARRNLYYGLFEEETRQHILSYMPGFYTGMQVGSAIGGLASLYDAAQRR